jgi:hypothetical protein
VLQHARPGWRVTISLAIYLACVALVCSFILFEVLDVDGSDFQPPARATGFLQQADHTNDLRRACWQGTGLPSLEAATPRTESGDVALVAHRLVDGGARAHAVDPLLYPVPLPRSSLPHPTPAA